MKSPTHMALSGLLALAISGCQVSTLDDNESVSTAPIDAGSEGTSPDVVTPLFNPARSIVPLVSDFLYSGSTDGTLVYSGAYDDEGEEIPVLTSTGELDPDYNPVYSALNDLEGFSTNAPFYIAFNGALAETQPAASVYLVPLDYGGDPKQGSLNTTVPFQVLEIPQIQVEVTGFADGTANSLLKISPLEPLMSNTRYLVVILGTLEDAKGNPVAMANQYEYLLGEEDLLSDALAPVRTLVQGWQELAEGFVAGVASRDESVVMAYTFTTTATTAVMNAMAAPGNLDSQLSNAAIPAAVQYYLNTTDDDTSTQLSTLTAMVGNSDTALTILTNYTGLATLPAPTPRAVDFSTSASVSTALLMEGAQSSFRTGRLSVPYYLEAPQGAYEGEDPTTGYACSGSDVSCLMAQLTAANLVTSEWQADEDVLYNLMLALTGQEAVAAQYSAPSDQVTSLFPLAEQQGMVSVPVMLVEPVSGCVKPAEGWPVVIYQHGLRGHRLETLPLADQLAQACYATLAMDLPLHGPTPTSTFSYDLGIGDVDIPVLAAVLASENSTYGLNTFLGLDTATQTLLIQSQTLQQRHFGLTANASGSPTAMSSTDDSANVSGSLYINLIHFQTARDATRQAVMDLMNLNAAIPFIDFDNDSNADLDADKVHFVGISLGAIVGTEFVAVNNANEAGTLAAGNSALNPIQAAVFGMPGGGLAKMLENSPSYGPLIVGGLTSADGFNLTQGSEDYESLLQVYQATLDASDPLNYMAQLKDTGTPFSLLESIGDLVIPNRVTTAPLSGTEAMIDEAGLTSADTTTDFSQLTPVQVAIRFADDYSNHSSLAVPDTDESTLETEATFGVITNHILSLFSEPTSPSLNDGGAGIVETVTE